jgi:hypothetical protein
MRFKIDNRVSPLPGDLDDLGELMIRAEGCEPPHPPAEKKDGRKVVRSHASYLTQLFEDHDVCVQQFRVKMRAVDFDTVVGTGISGTLAAQMFARAMGINFAIVRKGGDGSHSYNPVEGNVGRRWVFVDDLICSGATRQRVRDAMELFSEQNDFKTTYVGDYLYYGNSFRAKGDGNA